MRATINTQKVKRIWEAEKELVDAIEDAQTEGIVVQVEVLKYSGGSERPCLLIKQLIFP